MEDRRSEYDLEFTVLPDVTGKRDSGPAVLKSLTTWEPHRLYTYSSYEDCFRIATTSELYRGDQQKHTERYIELEALPNLLVKGDVQATLSIVMFLHCPDSCGFIHRRARELALMLILKNQASAENDYILRLIEVNLMKILKQKCPTSELDDAEYRELEQLYLTVLGVIMKSYHDSRKHNEYVVQDRRTTIDTVKAFEKIKCCQVAEAVQACKTANVKALSSVKPKIFHAALIWILQEIYQEPTSELFACLPTMVQRLATQRRLSFSASSAKSAKWGSLSSTFIMNSFTSLLRFLFDRIQNKDRAETAARTLKTIVCTLKSQKTFNDIEQLLFHRSSHIKGTVVDLFVDKECFSEKIIQANLSAAQSLLSHCVLPSTKGSRIKNEHPDGWEIFSLLFSKNHGLIHFQILPANEHKDGPDSHGRLTPHENDISFLRIISGHRNIVQLLGYHWTTLLPRFYITEDYTENCLQNVLVHRSIDRDWFSVETLKSFLVDVLNAVEYVHKNKIVHRDLTAHSVFVDGSTAKLARFHLARSQHNAAPVIEPECNGIPTRWSAPESLTKRCFSTQSDIWMFGHMIYEIITHGCLPYSDNQGKDDTEVVQLITGKTTPLCHEPCISDELFQLICQCTEPEVKNRPSIEEIKSVLREDIRTRRASNESSSSVRILAEAQRQFPNLKTERTPATEFKRGIPISAVMPSPCTSPGGSTDSVDSGKGFSAGLVRRPSFIFDQDSIIIQEVISSDSPTQVWSLINEKDLPGIPPNLKICSTDHEKILEISLAKQTHGYVYLDEVLVTRKYNDEEEEYIQDLKTAAVNLRDLHNKGWIHGELMISNILVQRAVHPLSERKVWFTQLTRMAQLPQGENNQRQSWVKLPELLGNRSLKRSAPEVIKNAIYSTQSDVFSFALIVWEAFRYLSEPGSLPMSTFDALPQEDRYYTLTSQNLEKYFPKPSKCSTQLYVLLTRCWNVVREQRPRMDDIIAQLESSLEKSVRRYDSIASSASNDGDDSYVRMSDVDVVSKGLETGPENTTAPEIPPKRNKPPLPPRNK